MGHIARLALVDTVSARLGLGVALLIIAGVLLGLGSLAAAAWLAVRRRSRDALRAGQSLLQALIEGTTDSVYVKDRRGRYLIVNEACARSFGVSATTLTGQDPAAFLPPDEARPMREMDAEVVRTAQPRRGDVPFTKPGQATRIYETLKAPYCDRAGEVIGIIGISRDVTEQRAAETTRAWLAAIVESSADAIVGETLGGAISSWNAAAERIFGYSAAEALGQDVTMLVPPEERAQLAWLSDHVRHGERIVNHETVRRRKDGTKIGVTLTLSPILDAAGAVVGASAIARDLTECAERQRLACEAAHVGMWFWTPKDDRLVWTPLCRRLFGIGPDEALSHARYLAAIHVDDRERATAEVARALAERTDYQLECRVVWPDGSVHWIAGCGRVLVDEEGEPLRLLGTATDVTAQKEAERERVELLARADAARAEAEEATRAKDEFLAVVSHELRTPLQAMLGWTLLLKTRLADAPAAQPGLAAIERNVKTQARLVEDLVDVSRIVTGKMRLTRERVDLAEVVAAAIEPARAKASAKGVQLEATPLPPSEVVGDPVRLHQVVSNVLDNAVKFTPAGGRIRVRLERSGTLGRVVVEDSGPGISPDFLPQVFDRFRQAEAGTGGHGGLGLGLAIVRHLVERHGGTVRAESPGLGKGATFTVTLPLVSSDQPALAAEPRRTPPSRSAAPIALGGVRVLVVDDDADARTVLGMALHDAGADVHTVGSARAAIDEIGSFHPHLLLSDIGMPDEDGYTLIREIRERESAEGGHLPAVALTAFASQADREQALALGFEAYLAKPASPADLAATVARLVAPGDPSASFRSA